MADGGGADDVAGGVAAAAMRTSAMLRAAAPREWTRRSLRMRQWRRLKVSRAGESLGSVVTVEAVMGVKAAATVAGSVADAIAVGKMRFASGLLRVGTAVRRRAWTKASR